MAIGHGRFNPLGLLADKVVNIISFITNEKACEGKHIEIETVVEVTAEVLLAEIALDRCRSLLLHDACASCAIPDVLDAAPMFRTLISHTMHDMRSVVCAIWSRQCASTAGLDGSMVLSVMGPARSNSRCQCPVTSGLQCTDSRRAARRGEPSNCSATRSRLIRACAA